MKNWIHGLNRTVQWRGLGLLITIGAASYIVLITYQNWTEHRDTVCNLHRQSVKPETLALVNNDNRDALDTDYEDVWRPLVERSELFVYSAYYDLSIPDRIRVIGVMPTNNKFRPWCQINAANTTIRTRADVVNINEEHGKRLTATYFVCYLCNEAKLPDMVGISSTEDGPVTILNVHVILLNAYKHNFTICVAPFNNKYSKAKELIEWIEMNTLLGVTHFTFYNFSATQQILEIVDYYRRIGRATLLQWNIDLINDTLLLNDEILHYYGQLAAINDCLYRNKGLSKYLEIIDLDELIIPRHRTDFTLYDMFARLPISSVYVFSNAFFLDASNSTTTLEHSIKFFRMNHRPQQIRRLYRSKIIVTTTDVVTLGIHNIWSMKSVPGQRHVVDHTVGLLHHYRDSSELEDDHVIKDRTIGKYKTLTGVYNFVLQNMKKRGLKIT